MPWTEQNQAQAVQVANAFATEFKEKMAAWQNAVQAGTQSTGQAAVEDVVRRWQQNLATLQTQSDALMSNDSVIESLGQLAAQLADEKETLRRLRSEAGTRADQSDSVNPKDKASPYTNILGLQRIFRSSTRYSLIVTSIIFGILSLGTIGFFVYQVVTSGMLVKPGYIQASTSSTGLFGR